MCVRIPTAWCLRSRAEASRQGVSLDDARASSTVFALSTPLLLGNPLPSYLNPPSIPPSFPPLFLSFPPLSPLHLSSSFPSLVFRYLVFFDTLQLSFFLYNQKCLAGTILLPLLAAVTVSPNWSFIGFPNLKSNFSTHQDLLLPSPISPCA